MGSKPNALPSGREFVFRKQVRMDATPEAVYDVLADVRSHLEWGGNRSKKNFRLTGIEVDDTPARVGTKFSSTGVAPDGTFQDRSIVTHATRPTLFEFVTDAHITLKKGGEADWKLINRYEIAADQGGSRVTYTQRLTEATELGPMKMMMNPILAAVGRMMVGALIKPGLHNLGVMAKERSGSR